MVAEAVIRRLAATSGAPLKTAKAMGLIIPEPLLLLADEVIE